MLHRRSRVLRTVAVLAVTGALVAACGSGKSVTEAGLDPIAPPEAAPTTVAPTGSGPVNGSDDPTVDDGPSEIGRAHV